jgi:outer membrane immunogenic protein
MGLGQVMKKILLVGVSAFAMAAASGAYAADLPAYTKAPKAVPYNWTGFYLGFQGGFATANAELTRAPAFSSQTFQPNGGFAGGTIGYNWQFAGPWVFGLEADGAWADVGASWPGNVTATQCSGLNPRCQAKMEGIETFRGRLGYAFGYVLPYVTGGLGIAQLHAEEGDVAANGPFGSGTKSEAGWVAGAGVEAGILPHWTVKMEGLYGDFGNHTIFTNSVGNTESLKFNTALYKFGFNYKFW